MARKFTAARAEAIRKLRDEQHYSPDELLIEVQWQDLEPPNCHPVWTKELLDKALNGDFLLEEESEDDRDLTMERIRRPAAPVAAAAAAPAAAPAPARKGPDGALKKLTRQRAIDLAPLLAAMPGRSASVSGGDLPCGRPAPKVKPCYLFKLEVTTEHQKGTNPPAPPPPPDPNTLKREIHALETDLDRLHGAISKRIARGVSKADLKQERDRKQKQLLEKIVQLSQIPSPEKPEEREDMPRRFTVVAHYPKGWTQAMRPFQQQLFALQGRLRARMAMWQETHEKHEAKRKEVAGFFAKVQKAEVRSAQSKGEAERIARTWAQKDTEQTEVERLLEERVKARRELDAITARPHPMTDGARAAESSRINALNDKLQDCDQKLDLLDATDVPRRLRLMDQLLTAKETAADANASDVARRKATAKAAQLTKKLRDILPDKKSDSYREALGKASKKANARQFERDRLVREFDTLRREEDALRHDLENINREVEHLVTEINELETHVADLRNILPSGDDQPIEITAGSDTPWYKHFGASVKTTDRSWKASDAIIEDPVKVTVVVDRDSDLRGWHADFGPHAIEHCAASGSDGVEAGKEHPYLEITGGKQDIKQPKAGTKTFTALQKTQFDDQLAVPMLTPWNQCLRVLRVAKEVFGGKPRLREFVIEAETCGRTPNAEKDVGASLSKKVIVYPSDSFEITIKSNAFAGISYTHEEKHADASRPQSETGQLQPESSGSKNEVTVSDTHTTSSLWGMDSKSVTTGTIKGTGDPSSDKDLQFTTTTTVSGLDTKQQIHMDGTFAGEAYTGTAQIATHDDGTGNVGSGGVTSVSESGAIHVTVDGQDTVVPSRNDSGATTSLERVPPFPSTWFPVCPVDISFKRNGMEDEFTQRIKQVVAIIVFLARQAANVAARLNNWVPALGWKVTFSCDILAGSLSIYKQYREHVDRRVYPYTKAELDLKCFLLKIGIFGGAWFELLFLEFKAGIEVTLDGYVGVKGAISTAHPDAAVSGNVGFGNTGGIGATAEIKVIVGSAEWCRVAAGLTSGFDIEGMTWVMHEEGPHMELGVRFRGVKLYVTAFLVLVGSWEFSHFFLKENDELYSRRFPPQPDVAPPLDDLIDQNDTMDAVEEEMREEGREAELSDQWESSERNIEWESSASAVPKKE